MITDFRASQMFLFLHKAESVASIARRLRMSGKTVRKYRDADQLPSQIEPAERSYRTREDPLTEFWDEITALLERDPRLKPYAILDWLKQKYNPPEGEPRVSDSIRRTLERRVQSWKLQQGIEQEVKFPQTHHPGDVIAFDFVVLNSLQVTLAGKPFDHLLFHAVFTYSNWEYVHLCHSESFEALSAGLQDALHRAGGVPRRVRSDSLSAAVNNLSDDKEFATAYRDLLAHYGVQGHRINVRKPHENGDVESSHRHFKDIVDQALRLRGSRDFATADDYMVFVRQLARRRNDERAERFREEIAALGPLPAQRRGTSTSILVTVKSDSIIRVKRNAYSVSSKYIGLELEVRIHQDHLELRYRNECLERMPRLFGCGKEDIDFRHVIDSLSRKPGAFVNYKYVNHMYPTTRFRMTYEQAAREHWTHTQFLAELVDQECQTRTQSRIVRLMRDANLLAGKTWEQFDWSRLPLHVTQQFETLRQGDFLNRQDNLLLFGKPGSGKTMLLSALGDQLVKQGRSVCFATCQMLVQELLRAKRDLRLERLIKKLQKFEALIIDDLGYVQQSREEMEVLFTLLSERYERGSVLLSSNLPFSKWEQIFKDPMTTAAAIDRLIHHSVIIELNIPSYRLDEAKKKQPKSARSADGLKA